MRFLHIRPRLAARLARWLPLLSIACAVTYACVGDGPTGSRPPSVVLGAVTHLTPGETATLTGRNLSRITVLTVDGEPVALAPGSDTERTFPVPTLRPCETDGRPVQLLAVAARDTVRRTEPLQVRGTVSMQVGESRVLTRSDLEAMKCLQFEAADHDYVVTALHTGIEAVDRADTLLVFRTWTESATPAQALLPAPTSARVPTDLAAPHVHADRALLPTLTAPAAYQNDPVPFDPRYATAQVGDTVRFVNWTPVMARYDNCFLPRDQIPTYPVLVIAVSGSTVIGVDLRLPNAAAHLTSPTADVYRAAAAIVDPVLLPAMRATFDRAYQPPRGGGGRHWMIVTSVPTALAGDGGTSLPQSYCPVASEMITSIYPGSQPPQAGNAPAVAGTYIHEYAHNAYAITYTALRSGVTHGGWPSEAWPELAIDVAARLSLGQPVDARPEALDGTRPYSPLVSHLWAGMLPSRSPWGPRGRYNHASSLLLYAREKRGDADYRTAPSLFSSYAASLRTHPNDPDGEARAHLTNLASAVGMDPLALLDEWALAHATDDLVATEAARARGLPQLTSWSSAGWASRRAGAPRHSAAAKTLSRTTNTRRALVAAPGSYDAVYLMAGQGKGLSLEVISVPEHPVRVRLTRLR